MKQLKYKLIGGTLYFLVGYRNPPSYWGRNYLDIISTRIGELKRLYPGRKITTLRPRGVNTTTYFYVSIGETHGND